MSKHRGHVHVPGDYSRYTLEYACVDGDLAALETLINNPGIKEKGLHYALDIASVNGHVAVVKRLLKDPRVDPTANSCSAFGKAIINCRAAVAHCLLDDPRVYIYVKMTCSTHFLYSACQYGVACVLARILACSSYDLVGRHDYALMTACKHGHVEVVNILLNDDRTDTTNTGCAALKAAIKGRHMHVVQRLLQDNRITTTPELERTITDNDFDGFKRVLAHPKNGMHVNHMHNITSDGRVDFLDHIIAIHFVIPVPSYHSEQPLLETLLELACRCNQHAIVNRLLCEPLDLTTNSSLQIACARGYFPIVVSLLKDVRIVVDRSIIWSATIGGNIDIVNLLLKYPHVDPSFDDDGCLQLAVNRGHIDVAIRYMQDPRVDVTQAVQNVEFACDGFPPTDSVRIRIAQIVIHDLRLLYVFDKAKFYATLCAHIAPFKDELVAVAVACVFDPIG